MTNWRTAKLEEVAQVLGGGTPSRREERFFGGSIAWATPTDITSLNSLYISHTKETITEEGLQNSSTRLMPAGSVLLTSRATIGFTAVASTPICTNQGFVNFICGPDLVPEFLAYWLRTQKQKMFQFAGGTTFKEIARGTLRKFKIAFPATEDQRHVVDILARAEGIVRLRREAQKKAAELIPALFLNMFGDPATNPKGWPTKGLGDLVLLESGGTPSKARNDYWCGTLPWVSPKDMKTPYIFDSIDHINDKVLAETNIKPVPIGAILIVVRGMILVHTVPVACAMVPITINQDMKAMVPCPEIASSYILWLLRVLQPHLLKMITTAAHGTRKLDTARLEELVIPIPPISAQHFFELRVEEIRSVQAQQAAATQKAEATFDALLAHSFNGNN